MKAIDAESVPRSSTSLAAAEQVIRDAVELYRARIAPAPTSPRIESP